MHNQHKHFDNIASGYDELLPKHYRKYLLAKKTRLTMEALKKYGIWKGKGIDLGCGTGWYTKHISEHGYQMVAIDNSSLLVEEAKRNNRDNNAVIKTGDILSTEFDSESFDFAYCINSLHHLGDDEALVAGLSEIQRIIKKGGLFLVYELNTFFLFRVYLNYIFPLTNKIDSFGGENWIEPKKLFKFTQGLFEIKELRYYTFFPHVIPKSMFNFFCKVNVFMERISLGRFGVHYMAVLKK